jgi:hypothetical protein
MLTGITTRRSTPQEDAAPWPGGSRQPVLAHLTGPVGMSAADARELLTAARSAQAETGPGWLLDYPVPGGDDHLLIHYAPGSRSYRFTLTAQGGGEATPGAVPQPGTPPGPDEPPAGRETPHGGPSGGGSAPAPGQPAPPWPAVTVTIWHNVAFDDEGRHIAMLDGYQPGDPVVAVFTYHRVGPAGQTAEQIADEAFDTFNGHPRDSDAADLTVAYYDRELRSLSVGDVVAVAGDGEVRLAVAKIGWTPVPGPLTEVRTSEHGTHPLPAVGPASAADLTEGEQHL